METRPEMERIEYMRELLGRYYITESDFIDLFNMLLEEVVEIKEKSKKECI
jgi:hypothetical protein